MSIPRTLLSVLVLAIAAGSTAATAKADNNRLNNSVVADVYAVQHQAGCTNDVRPDPQLRLAAQWHTLDVLNNHNLDADIGSDGSTPQDRANAAGYHGAVAETVAINPALAISGIELINQWYDNPDYHAIMANCANTASASGAKTASTAPSSSRYMGSPSNRSAEQLNATAAQPDRSNQMDPNPDYDASDEVEYGMNWFAWILRGVYPPPAYPPV